MAWKHDQPPINYLKRRVKYYKKKRAKTRSIAADEFFISKYGKEKIQDYCNQALVKIEKRIKQFEKAIKKLEQ